MCGIAGVVGGSLNREQREDLTARMLGVLRHRGPDDRSIESDGAATLGVARLSIIDRAGGKQPMSATLGGRRGMIAYNGEVYNFRELRSRLKPGGFPFVSCCDTEAVLASTMTGGEEAVSGFDGMFAFAYWDASAANLLLVRDRLGIKPIFYAEFEGAILFGSEPKSLLASGVISAERNEEAVLEYFLHGFAFASGYVTGERTFYKAIRALSPGHSLRWRDGSVSVRRYWRPLDDFGAPNGSRADAPELLAATLRESVRHCLDADVPVGTALSGGIDSSVITSDAVELTPRPILSSCITFREDRGDPDAHHAALLSRWLNARHPGCHRLEYAYVDSAEYLDGVNDLVDAFDEPHWELRQIGMMANYRRLAECGSKVVLAGEGADELFFGYYQRFPGFRRPQASSPQEFSTHWLRRAPLVTKLLAPAFASGGLAESAASGLVETAVADYLQPYWEQGGRLRAIQCWYMQTFLPWLLMVNDRCSMRHSVEGRFPFLLRDIVKMALQMPPDWNIDDFEGLGEKAVLRKASAPDLPPEIWRDRGKSPLPVPQHVSYHRRIYGALQNELDASKSPVWDLLDRGFVRRLAAAFARDLAQWENSPYEAGPQLTRYLPLDGTWEVRSAHLFAILTFIRWYAR